MSHFVCDNLVLSCCQKIKGMLVCLHQLSTLCNSHNEAKLLCGLRKDVQKGSKEAAGQPGTVWLRYCERAVSVIQ